MHALENKGLELDPPRRFGNDWTMGPRLLKGTIIIWMSGEFRSYYNQNKCVIQIKIMVLVSLESETREIGCIEDNYK